MPFMEIGKINEFEITQATQQGHYIKLVDSKSNDIFMPWLKTDKQKSLDLKVGQVIEAFVYQNGRGEIEASLLLPYAEVEEFVVLKVVDKQDFGAFLDWGIEKDLLVPERNQKEPMQVGEYYLVRICYDSTTGKIYGTTKFGSFLEDLEFYFDQGDLVEVIPAETHELGYRCIVNRKYLGMIYHNEIFTEIDLDQAYDGYVKKIRDDGLVDISLQPIGSKRVDESEKKILKLLEDNGGHSKLNDKSSPADIRNQLGISKQTFKDAIGRLYKARKILISKNGIELTKK